MIINLVYGANALAAPQSFRDGMQAAADILRALIINNITINIDVGYGEFDGTALPPETSEGGDEGVFETYANLRGLLANHENSAADITSVNALPATTSLNGQTGFFIGRAEAKALGVLSVNDTAIDGIVGMGVDFTGDVLVGAALHELTHAMGRVPGASALSLFRYTSAGQHLFAGNVTPAPASYFSIDGGNTKLADFGVSSDPSDFLNAPASSLTPIDPFDEFVSDLGSYGLNQTLTSVDMTIMDVLGFDVTLPPPSDFSGYNASDILWRNSNGLVDIWTEGNPNNASLIANVDPSWQVAGVGDFGGDLKEDILWRNTNGLVDIWTDGDPSQSALIANVDTSWQIAGVGDFNGDDRADILWRNSNGLVDIWTDGNPNQSSLIANVDTSWQIAGVGDFNGDGEADILWRNTSGLVDIWTDGNPNQSSLIANVDTSWQIAGVGDFNGDGKSDILWRNSNGLVDIWTDGNPNQSSLVADVDLSWQIAGVGDFNSDGKADILWRNTNGLVDIWTDGSPNQSSVIANVDPSWAIQDAGTQVIAGGSTVSSPLIAGGALDLLNGAIVDGPISFASGSTGTLFDADRASDLVMGFAEGADYLSFAGQTAATEAAVVASAQLGDGNTVLTFPDHTALTLAGVSHVDAAIFA